MIAVEQWKSKCQMCKQDLSYDEEKGWKCTKLPGNHRVERKTYYHMGGSSIQNERDRRGWAPLVILDARPDELDPRSGKTVSKPPIEAQFAASGLFVTEDPQIQFFLETRCPQVGWGEAGRKNWEKIYLTPTQRRMLSEAELESIQKQITEQNTLLDQVKNRAKREPAHA